MAAPQQQQSYHTITLPLDISKASQWQHPKYLPFEKIQLKRWNSLIFSRRRNGIAFQGSTWKRSYCQSTLHPTSQFLIEKLVY
jgi:hypothetical protein